MKTAIVLFNLGGPDNLDAVKPFLFNLFNDKAIIGLPQPLRYLVAKLISTRRAPFAKDIYSQMGGKSPILELTNQQAQALEKELLPTGEYKVFVAMRYWKPFTKDVVDQVKDYNPDKVILLPLYPQYSTTTSGSSFKEWYKQAKIKGLEVAHHNICCYPFDTHFIDAHIQAIQPIYKEAEKHGKPRILFSAHGLPQKIIDKGDPYQWQVEKTVSKIMAKLGNYDFVICYQSRVGPLKWITPSTNDEIARAGKDGVPIVVVPIAFVSEHSETLVELDIEYKHLADVNGVPKYLRVPALATAPEFIKSLAWLVEATKMYPNCSNSLGRQCPKEFGKCGFSERK
jgi:protoporphyrin/coproporphyrin ferrochelatase